MATDPPPPPAYTAKDGSPPPEYVHEDIVKVKLDDCHHSTADAVLTLISLVSVLHDHEVPIVGTSGGAVEQLGAVECWPSLRSGD